MNSENSPKEIMQSFIDLANMTKGLMDINQQPPVTKELGPLFPITSGRGWSVKTFLGLVLVNHLL